MLERESAEVGRNEKYVVCQLQPLDGCSGLIVTQAFDGVLKMRIELLVDDAKKGR